MTLALMPNESLEHKAYGLALYLWARFSLKSIGFPFLS